MILSVLKIEDRLMKEVLATAIAQQRARKHHQAATAFRKVLAQSPSHPVALHGLGLINHQFGHNEEAVSLLRQAVAAAPKSPEFRSNFAAVLGRLGRHGEAVEQLREAVQLQPGYVDAWCNLGVALERLNRAGEACDAYQRAIALRPQHPRAHNSLGNALRRLGRLDEAEMAFREAIRLSPSSAGPWSNLAAILSGQGRLDEVIAARRRVVELRPKSAAAHSALLATLHYDEAVTPGVLLAEAREWAGKVRQGDKETGRQGEGEKAGAGSGISNLRSEISDLKAGISDLKSGRRIRVGFLSSNLTSHPEGRFLRPMLANFDRTRFETFCYANIARPDALSGTLRHLCDHWRDVRRLPDGAAAELIQRDAIDVLIDLTGHFGNNRMTLFARRIAPVQATLFGYPGTSGLATMDWRFTDRSADPPIVAAGDTPNGIGPYAANERRGDACYTTERLLGLGECAWCYEPSLEARAVGPLPALQNGYVPFACVNNALKVTPQAIEAWSKILLSVPNSRLMILSERTRRAPAKAKDASRDNGTGAAANPPGRFANVPITADRAANAPAATSSSGDASVDRASEQAAASEYLFKQFRQHGIDAGRVALVPRQTRARYFEWIHAADIALDPYPYNGGVTTCDTLWMGVPVISRAGAAYWSRQGAMLLGQVGLDDLVATDWREYVEKATQLALDLPRLQEIRSRLREKMRKAPICDAVGYTKRFGDALTIVCGHLAR
jgi:predicted O-linked N-acetylglucosamine transferase (SPINDLY family)